VCRSKIKTHCGANPKTFSERTSFLFLRGLKMIKKEAAG